MLLGLAFIASGVHKFMDLPGTVGMFSGMGLPGALAYIIASAEVLGGIGLLVPRFTWLAAAGLVIVMAGAVVMHATKIPGGLAKGVPAIVLLLVLIVLRRAVPAQRMSNL
ncbi:DoxX family protein [Hymenobacter caeli]|uniref:Membrane protein YphA (DoxX/SURF4 family) n=1 Tax=Hymenobacter caeli TaxID=2735894 RepID=A0ABX2FXZ3_9BACT|nr:DoxX family protein [Hymenobacter caeli]NRT21279.1 putative membrane protein YphA (DoxX/SURF4 family) [Hymenobacter caeli]